MGQRAYWHRNLELACRRKSQIEVFPEVFGGRGGVEVT
jgi:hypothetical protein